MRQLHAVMGTKSVNEMQSVSWWVIGAYGNQMYVMVISSSYI